jgi:hypothetical protein
MPSKARAPPAEKSDAENRGEMVLVSTETDDRDMGASRTERNCDVDLRGGTDVRPAHANRRAVYGSRWLTQCRDKDAISAGSSGSTTLCSSSEQAGDPM